MIDVFTLILVPVFHTLHDEATHPMPDTLFPCSGWGDTNRYPWIRSDKTA